MSDRRRRPRVAFDHRIFVYQKYGGVSRYYARLVEHLPEFRFDAKVISPLYMTEYVRDLPKGSVWGRHVTLSKKATRRGFVLGELLHRPLARAYGADIVHETYHHPRNVAPEGARIVTTVHDMIHEMYPGGEAVRRDLALQVARAHAVICISESTRRDLLRVHPEIEAKTHVVLHGVDEWARGEDSPSPHPRPYLLYVGVRSLSYKNFEGLLEAYGTSPALRDAFDLVCIGGGAFTDAERLTVDRMEISGKLFQHDADDIELRNFYHHAQLFVYPSLYEGFGFPPLEAMAADCPVVTMHSSSMPEVCGDAVEYAFPDEPGSLRAAIEKVALTGQQADALRVAGRERVKRFSWRECARKTGEVYKSLL